MGRGRTEDDQLALGGVELGEQLGFGEQWMRRRGHDRIAGVDEVGRGPLAGPVVAAACVLPRQLEDELVQSGLDDSKRMGDELRASLSDRIRTEAHYGLGVVGAARIDETDILRASLEAMRHAVDALVTAYGHYPDCLLVDGKDVITPAPWPGARQHALVRGDGRAVCIAAASVIAKVHRDRLMIDYDAQYPGYGFAANKGYGAAEHRDALRRLGPSPIHRRSFGASADDSAETQASLF